MNRKVVITGMNMITALGLDKKTSWDGLIAGKSGIRKISLFDSTKHLTRIAGELPEDFDDYAKRFCNRHQAKQMARATRCCYVCTKEAVLSSGIDFSAFDKMRCGVIFGAVDTGHSAIYDDKYWVIKTMVNGMSAWVSLEYKLEGANYTVSSACASAAYAIAQGYDLIKANKADVVITGGASSIVNPEHVKGFNELYALSAANDIPEKASRPFSIDRDGFVIGEGAGVLILESEESARARGAKIHAELLGYSLTSEAYNIMAPMKDGTGMARTMALALDHAGLNKVEVDYINAHGTSTALNDRYETMAIKRVFGDLAFRMPVSSTKSMIGHTASACGAIEAIITIMSTENNILPPTINYTPDPELDLDYVPNIARKKEIRIALSNSFGFGGHNATLVIGKYELQR